MAVDYLSAINQGGSGLNVTQIVDSLVQAEQVPQENQIQSKIDARNTAISAIGEIKSALSKLSTSLSALFGNTSLKVNSSSSAISATISNPSTAVAINSTISVSTLAKGQTLAFEDYSSKAKVCPLANVEILIEELIAIAVDGSDIVALTAVLVELIFNDVLPDKVVREVESLDNALLISPIAEIAVFLASIFVCIWFS